MCVFLYFLFDFFLFFSLLIQRLLCLSQRLDRWSFVAPSCPLAVWCPRRGRVAITRPSLSFHSWCCLVLSTTSDSCIVHISGHCHTWYVAPEVQASFLSEDPSHAGSRSTRFLFPVPTCTQYESTGAHLIFSSSSAHLHLGDKKKKNRKTQRKRKSTQKGKGREEAALTATKSTEHTNQRHNEERVL